MSKITVEIDGKKCEATEGEFILNIARRNGIFIPALCYLTGCSPTLACRLCLVEADGKRVYSCNAKAKDGMVITTSNEEIEEERESIMSVYDVNHPLQCGVCDQSGECELQNYTLYMRIKEQKYTIRDTYRPVKNWGLMKYDAGLCIVCEKCVTVCKDMIGDSVLKTVPRGGDPLDKELKNSMPKDSFAMWNKLQKSIIGTVNEDDTLECQDCGECISVCPVGALVSTDFQYQANAWELKKIPASNPHSSDCNLMYYEVKHGDAKNYDKKIFRVTNEHHYAPLNGAARFGFDFENRVKGQDEVAFNNVINFLKEADTIKFNSYITNEEALILQKLKEKLGVKLVNDDALRYQEFLKAYQETSGKTLYSGNIKSIRESNFLITVGTQIRYDAPNVGFALNNALTINKGAGLYFHPVGDRVVEGFAKNIMMIENKPLSEEHTLAFVLEFLGKALEVKVPSVKYDNKLVNLPEDFETKITKMLAKKDKFALIIGEDCYTHPNAKNIAKIVGLIDKNFDAVNVTIIPSQTNTLGVSQICELDSESGNKIFGYNESADCVMSALGDGDLDAPALNQQEGTFTNLDKRVVPTNAALEYRGYTINMLAAAFGIEKEYTALYTKELPVDKGYQAKDFDELPNYYDNGGVEHRGYLLDIKECKSNDKIDKLSSVSEINTPVYRSNPINQFNCFTNKAHQLKEDAGLYVSSEYLEQNGLKDGQTVKISDLEISVKLDKQLKGMIPYLPTFDKNVDVTPLFKDGYRFSQIKVEGV